MNTVVQLSLEVVMTPPAQTVASRRLLTASWWNTRNSVCAVPSEWPVWAAGVWG